MSNKMCDVRPVGRFRIGDLVFDEIKCFDARGNHCGSIVMGTRDGSCLIVNGVEVGVGQQDDPGAVRVFSAFTNGIGGGGKLCANRWDAGDQVFRENAMINMGTTDHPDGDDRGMIQMMVKPDAERDMESGLIITTQFSEERWGLPRRVWVGLRNFVGGMWKYGNSGDAPPINDSAVGRRIALRAVANGRLVCAEAEGGQPLIANRDAVGPWEMFDVIVIE